IGQSVSMRYLASYVTNIAGAVVVDRTGLAGSYDFKIEVPFSIGSTDKRVAVSEAFLDAMRRLGLNSDSQKAPVEMLVIDRAEEPSSNLNAGPQTTSDDVQEINNCAAHSAHSVGGVRGAVVDFLNVVAGSLRAGVLI